MAISRLETGHFTSKRCIKHNNFGGMRTKDGFMVFSTREEGAIEYVNMLKVYYFDEGLNTVESIQPKYCPDGGSEWTKLVKELME